MWRISDSRTYKFLYTLPLLKTLNLHSFRQKLAISELDKPFTPNVLSSHNIATLMSSAFHPVFNKVLACRPLARPVSSYNSIHKIMFLYSAQQRHILRKLLTRWPIMQKVRQNFLSYSVSRKFYSANSSGKLLTVQKQRILGSVSLCVLQTIQ